MAHGRRRVLENKLKAFGLRLRDTMGFEHAGDCLPYALSVLEGLPTSPAALASLRQKARSRAAR